MKTLELDSISSLQQIRTLNRESKQIVDVPRPFLKWAGGKRQLIQQVDEFIPGNYNKYIEPFVGGGALLFYLLPKKAIIIDNNQELINCYQVIKNSLAELIESLRTHKNEKEYFYKIRALDRDPDKFRSLSDIEKASRTIFLNRCCYNGLYRVNSKGQFNAPFGRYKNPKFCDEKNLNAVNIALQNVEIYKDTFEKCLDFAEKGDFIYFDPPYHPISSTAYFTSYTKESFSQEAQQRLFKIFKKLDDRGCKVMLSNSHNDFIKKLYSGYAFRTIYAKRAINSKASKRGKIKELLILNDFN